jgi:hypothetical protein
MAYTGFRKQITRSRKEQTMTKRQTQILNALKANPGYRAIRPNGTKWAVIDYSTNPHAILIDNISFDTVSALYYSDAGITDTSTDFLQYAGA